jgi:hypothetical protein
MKYIITLSIFFLCVGYTIEYNVIHLPYLIKKSKIIAHVKITNLYDTHFEAIVVENIKSAPESDTIKIKYFKNWNCARRWTSYKVGQEQIVFLNNSYNWTILGWGDEGEMPVFNGEVYYKSPFFVKTDCFKNEQNIKLQDSGIYGTKYDLNEVIAGVKIYLNDYVKTDEELNIIFQDGAIINYYPDNPFLKRAINELIFLNQDKFRPGVFEQRDFDS